MTTDGLLVLHISDLHFGNKSRFAGADPSSLGSAFYRALDNARQGLSIAQSIRFVVVSGDLTETGDEREFECAHHFLEALGTQCGLMPSDFVFVPGNHDISWPHCQMEVLHQQLNRFNDAELRRRIDDAKFTLYNSFLEQFNGCQLAELSGRHPIVNGGWLYDYPVLNVSVAAMNSCEKESHRPTDHLGYISEQQASSLMHYWSAARYDEWLKLLIVHHNPVATTSVNIQAWTDAIRTRHELDHSVIDRYASDVVGFEGKEFLRSIVADCRVHLVLHGHHHDQGQAVEWPWETDGRAPVLSTGSWGLKESELAADVPPSCQLLHFSHEQPGALRLQAFPLIFDGRFRLTGDLLPGNFVLDPARNRYSQIVQVGSRWRISIAAHSSMPPQLDTVCTEFVNQYRRRMHSLFDRWDLRYTGATQTGVSQRPVDAKLDAIFHPLRFDVKFDPKNSDRGAPIGVSELRHRFSVTVASSVEWNAVADYRPKPFIIRGPAGSGKTTWMRFTFRRLLEDEEFLPIMLVLRDLGRRWSDLTCASASRSIDAFLDEWVAQHLGAEWTGRLSGLLKAGRQGIGPKIVLIVDGWDELGPIGTEFREKLLGFANEFRHVLIVASSRPYGDGRPTSSDGFDMLDIQPLSRSDILLFAERFHRICYGVDAETASMETKRFVAALERSPEASELVQTALLLVMTLFISRTEQLPEKRHLLYERCLSNLLSAREQRGVPLTDEQWRPPDNEECWQVAASLACGIQTAGYREHDRSMIAMRSYEMSALLPERWTEPQRIGFINWLAGPAGIMTDRADGTFAFAHLSFQEYLTAWHLNATVVDVGTMVRLASGLIEDKRWWETLLLWIARLSGQSRERASSVIASLLEAKSAFFLLGVMIAEGAGNDGIVREWASRFVGSLRRRWPDEGLDPCVRAWRSSREHERRRQIAAELAKAASHCGLQAWQRLQSVYVDLGEDGEFPLPANVAAVSVIRALAAPNDVDERTIAAGRVLIGGSPLWPGTPPDLALLATWPSKRKHVSMRLQNAVAAGAARSDLFQIASRELALSQDGGRIVPKVDMRLIGWIPPDVCDDARSELADYWNGSWTRYWSQGWAMEWIPFWAETFREIGALEDTAKTSIDLAAKWADKMAMGFTEAQTRGWDRNWAGDWAEAWAKDWGMDRTPEWVEDFARVEFLSWGRGMARTAARRLPKDESICKLMTVAAWLSLNEGATLGNKEFESLVSECSLGTDPLFVALAKRLARRATNDDCEYLTHLAANPEERSGYLRWGLQFLVRGDVMLADGTFMLLDELSRECGHAPMRLLE